MSNVYGLGNSHAMKNKTEKNMNFNQAIHLKLWLIDNLVILENDSR